MSDIKYPLTLIIKDADGKEVMNYPVYEMEHNINQTLHYTYSLHRIKPVIAHYGAEWLKLTAKIGKQSIHSIE